MTNFHTDACQTNTVSFYACDCGAWTRAQTKSSRDAATVTAVHVARDWAIEQYGNRGNTPWQVVHYMVGWIVRNNGTTTGIRDVTESLVDAVWALAELPQQDPLTLIDDDYRGTSDEARAMLTAQYERDLTHALSRITWKDNA